MPPERLADRLLRTCDGVCPVSNLSELTDFVGQRQAEPAVAFSRFLLAVKIYFPNSGHLQNFGGFARRQDMSDTGQLEFSMDPRYVSVHPIALSMAAAAGQLALSNGGQVTVDLNAKGDSIRYLTRMRLMAALGQDPAVTMTEHAPEGRFIPVTTVQDQQDLNGFIVDMVPLLHASPEEVGPIKYVITELVRNVLEHAGSPVGALVSAQYFAQTSRLSLGVADLGVGIRASIAQSHNPQSDLDAIHLALRPGVTGTTARVGGNEQNAGAGLFFTKSIALTTRNFLVVYSGSAAFKLLKVPEKGQATLLSDPSADRATRETDLPSWPGTAIGVDINVGKGRAFAELLSEIRAAYSLDIRSRKKAKYRRPNFS